MSTPNQDLDKPVAMADGSEPVSDLTREPTVAGASVSPRAAPIIDDAKVDGAQPAEQPAETTNVHMHPNGSEGWLPAADAEDAPHPSPSNGTILRKSKTGSVHSRVGSSSRASLSPSIGRKSVLTNADGKDVNGSTFINGAGTTGPAAVAIADESLHAREASANASLTPKQKAKIDKNSLKDGKRLSKVIKQEAKVEKAAVGVSIKELSELQKIQKDAVKREAKAHTVHTRSLSSFQKYEASFLAARVKYETAQAQMNAHAEALDVARSNAREATENMQEKSQEVDGLRTMFGVDEREREVKLVELAGKKKTGWRL